MYSRVDTSQGSKRAVTSPVDGGAEDGMRSQAQFQATTGIDRCPQEVTGRTYIEKRADGPTELLTDDNR